VLNNQGNSLKEQDSLCVNEICVLTFNAASNGSFLQTFRDNLSVPSSRIKQSKKNAGEHIDLHYIRAGVVGDWFLGR
jgi:activator of 2-hydroxyglutaryl-CoA dehydratase